MTTKFCRPVVPNMSSVEHYLADSFRKGHLSNFGPAYYKLETQLKEFFNLKDNKEVIITSSGHTALMAAYKVLGVKKLLVPAFTFESTRTAATLQGIETIISDVDHKTGCLTPEILSKFNPKDYDSVVSVCALSTIPDLPALEKFCRDNNKKLIIDGAATFGTEGISNFGDAFCYSFHATKTFSVGEGGGLVINKNKYDIAKSFINFGFDNSKGVHITGMNAKTSEYTCAVALAMLDLIEDEIEARIDNYRRYTKFASRYIPRSSVDPTVYAFLPLFLPTEYQARRLKNELSSAGVENISYYKPIDGKMISNLIYDRSVCLPIHSGLTNNDFETIRDIINAL